MRVPVARRWECGICERPRALLEKAAEAFSSISNTREEKRQEENEHRLLAEHGPKTKFTGHGSSGIRGMRVTFVLCIAKAQFGPS